MTIISKKIMLTAIIPLALIIALSVSSFAATPITTTSLTGLAGITYNVVPSASGFTFSNPEYRVTLAEKVAASTWTDEGTMNTALVT